MGERRAKCEPPLRWSQRLLFCALLVICMGAHAEDAFLCGGEVEQEVWKLWDEFGKAEMRDYEMSERLLRKRDTYALYSVEEYTHNLVAMALRCKRTERLKELAEIYGVAFDVLEAFPNRFSVAWVCRGGDECTPANGYLNDEVMLNSAQFLGLMGTIAYGLRHVPEARQQAFVTQTAETSIKHLLRWADSSAMAMLKRQIGAKPADIPDASHSALLFTDKELWMITIYAELAGLVEARPGMFREAGVTTRQMARMQAHLARLIEFLNKRTYLATAVLPDGVPVQVAELDRGYWTLWEDFTYAGYMGEEAPVRCPGPVVKLRPPPPVPNLGWDISHSHRLVYAFDAVERNRKAMESVFGMEPQSLPAPEVVGAFAAQIVVRQWNRDERRPLFSNYWNGANGWYRVAYDDGTGKCREGYPPYFLTENFATGGYASWADYRPELRDLARRLYWLSKEKEGTEGARFMERFYDNLSAKASSGNRRLTQLMFYPSLVEAGQQGEAP